MAQSIATAEILKQFLNNPASFHRACDGAVAVPSLEKLNKDYIAAYCTNQLVRVGLKAMLPHRDKIINAKNSTNPYFDPGFVHGIAYACGDGPKYLLPKSKGVMDKLYLLYIIEAISDHQYIKSVIHITNWVKEAQSKNSHLSINSKGAKVLKIDDVLKAAIEAQINTDIANGVNGLLGAKKIKKPTSDFGAKRALRRKKKGDTEVITVKVSQMFDYVIANLSGKTIDLLIRFTLYLAITCELPKAYGNLGILNQVLVIAGASEQMEEILRASKDVVASCPPDVVNQIDQLVVTSSYAQISGKPMVNHLGQFVFFFWALCRFVSALGWSNQDSFTKFLASNDIIKTLVALETSTEYAKMVFRVSASGNKKYFYCYLG